MAKKYSDKLFVLIKSLSASEKRYFSLYTQKHVLGDGNKYQLLFQLIDNQEQFDPEALLLAMYPGEKPKTNKFTELTGYLFDLVMRSLRSYNEQKSSRLRIKTMLQNAEILYNKNLFEHCRDMLDKSQKLAEQFEDFNALKEILRWRMKIAYVEADDNYILKNNDAVFEAETSLLDRQQLLSAYEHLFAKMLLLVHKDAFSRGPEEEALLKEILDNPIMQESYEHDSYRTYFIYHRVHSLAAYFKGDVKRFYDLNLVLLESLQAHGHWIKEDPTPYIAVLTNLVNSCNQLGRYDEMNELLELFKEVEPLTINDSIRMDSQYYLNKMFYNLKRGEFEVGIDIAKESMDMMKKYGKILFPMSFYSYYAYLYFAAKNYDEAIKWLNKILEIPGEREDLKSIAHIMLILAHYEMGNYMLLEYLMRSTQRFLKQRNRLHAFEKAILKFIRIASGVQDKVQLKQAYKKLRDEFAVLANHPHEKFVFEYFDFNAWLEAQLNNEDLSKLVKLKFNQRA